MVKRNFTVPQILEKVSVYKTKLLLKLDKEVKDLENLVGFYLMMIFATCLKVDPN